MADEAKAEKEAVEIPMEWAVLIEFDNIVLGGREILYSALKKVLAAKSIALTPAAFSKYVLKLPLGDAITAIINNAGKKTATDKIKSDIEKIVLSGLSSVSLSSGKDLKALLKRAKEQNVAVGIVSSIPEDIMKDLLKKLGLSGLAEKVIQDPNGYQGFPTAETWMKLAKHTSMAPVCCLAVVSCSVSSKAALAAGMRCFIVPDKYTCFQDFGGASCIADTLSDVTKDMFELLESSR